MIIFSRATATYVLPDISLSHFTSKDFFLLFSRQRAREGEREREKTAHGVSYKSGGCWGGLGEGGLIRPVVRAENAPPALRGVRESQCAARRASCRTSWFYPRWATMYPDTSTTPSLTGRPPIIVNIHTQMIVPSSAWWVSATFYVGSSFRQHEKQHE